MSNEMKNEMEEAADLVNAESDVEAVECVFGVADGLDDAAAEVSQEALVTGASDLTRGMDAASMAERAVVLSEVVAGASVIDLAEGVEMLAARDDLTVQRAPVSVLGVDDPETAMVMGAIAGQLQTSANVVDMLDIPVLAAFFAERSDELQDLATGEVFKAGVMNSLAARVMGETRE